MTETCLNCANPVTENFCGSCGQKKYKRIDKKYIWDELQYTVFHTNKGLLYSVKNILKNPGKTAKEFIEGNRVNHYKPILLVFVLSGLATFISFTILNLQETMSAFFSTQDTNSKLMSKAMSLITSYNSLLMLLLVPIFAFITKIAFRKWGNNYYEHVVMNAYILSFYTLIGIIAVYPIAFFFRHSPTVFYNINLLSLLIIPVILLWFFKEFYNEKPLKSIIIKVIGVLGLTVLGYIILFILTGLVVGGLTQLK